MRGLLFMVCCLCVTLVAAPTMACGGVAGGGVTYYAPAAGVGCGSAAAAYAAVPQVPVAAFAPVQYAQPALVATPVVNYAPIAAATVGYGVSAQAGVGYGVGAGVVHARQPVFVQRAPVARRGIFFRGRAPVTRSRTVSRGVGASGAASATVN